MSRWVRVTTTPPPIPGQGLVIKSQTSGPTIHPKDKGPQRELDKESGVHQEDQGKVDVPGSLEVGDSMPRPRMNPRQEEDSRTMDPDVATMGDLGGREEWSSSRNQTSSLLRQDGPTYERERESDRTRDLTQGESIDDVTPPPPRDLQHPWTALVSTLVCLVPWEAQDQTIHVLVLKMKLCFEMHWRDLILSCHSFHPPESKGWMPNPPLAMATPVSPTTTPVEVHEAICLNIPSHKLFFFIFEKFYRFFW